MRGEGSTVRATNCEPRPQPAWLDSSTGQRGPFYESIGKAIPRSSLFRICSFSRRMRLWKPGRRGDQRESHYAHCDRHAGIRQHYHCAKPQCHHCSLRLEWYADRLGGSLERQLYFRRDHTQLRLGDHFGFGRIARRRLRHADRQVHAGQRQLRGV
jgi:hypothetical protein